MPETRISVDAVRQDKPASGADNSDDILFELLPTDGFAFTLLSCHCSATECYPG